MPLGIKVVMTSLDPLVVLLEMSAPLGGAADIVALVVVMAPVWESMGNITAHYAFSPNSLAHKHE